MSPTVDRYNLTPLPLVVNVGVTSEVPRIVRFIRVVVAAAGRCSLIDWRPEEVVTK